MKPEPDLQFPDHVRLAREVEHLRNDQQPPIRRTCQKDQDKASRGHGNIIFKKWANPGLYFVYFCSFLITISIQIEKSVDGVLGIRTWGRRMVDTDKTTELWRPPLVI